MTLFSAQHITVAYPRNNASARVLEDESFTLEAGEIYDLVGPSGAGKSTLLRACALMMARQGGELYLDGAPSTSFAPTVWRRRVCLVPQEPSLVPGTVRDNLVLPWTLKVHAHERPPEDEVLVNLLELAELSDVGLTRDVSQLSGGQAARVALLRAFATAPQVLLLDEVDAALDSDSACAVGRMTKALVGKHIACLRIRHRAADGFATGTYTLRDAKLTYVDKGPVSQQTACTEGYDEASFSVLRKLGSASVAPVSQIAEGGEFR